MVSAAKKPNQLLMVKFKKILAIVYKIHRTRSILSRVTISKVILVLAFQRTFETGGRKVADQQSVPRLWAARL